MTAPGEAKPLSERLIGRFGSLGATLSARVDERTALLGENLDVEETLRRVTRVMHHVLRGRLEKKPILGNERALLDYLRATMAFCPVESFRVLFLNAGGELLADEVTGKGSISRIAVFPREILRRALALDATMLVLAHNHPSGDPTPSSSDRDLTARIVSAAGCLDIVVRDHLVVGRGGWASFRQRGLL